MPGDSGPCYLALAILCLIGGALPSGAVPSVALDATASVNPLRCLRFLVQDRLFGLRQPGSGTSWGSRTWRRSLCALSLAASPDYLNLDAAYAVLLLIGSARGSISWRDVRLGTHVRSRRFLCAAHRDQLCLHSQSTHLLHGDRLRHYSGHGLLWHWPGWRDGCPGPCG